MSDLLRELLGPIEPSAFFEQHWERSPFAVTSHPPTWCSLMSVERFEEIVNAGGVAWPFIVGAKTEEKTETTAFRKRAPIDMALAHAEGWTLALQAAGRFDASLRRACAELGEQIGALVMANV